LTDSKKKQMADAVEEIEREGGNRAVKDLFAGAVGGVAQVLIGE
jgi:solute carrier family 25 carnitine/acylcarnitine transporter 20/29